MSQVTIEQALSIALAHYQAGRLPEAQVVYRQILAAHPNHPDALHMLGVIAGQGGRYDQAVSLISQAIAVVPTYAPFHSNIGHYLQMQGNLDAAIASYHRAIALDPRDPAARYNLGNAWKDKGQNEQAIASYQQALSLKPDYIEVLCNLGVVLQKQKRFDDAIAAYRRALAIKPAFVEALANLGNALKDRQQYDQALACYQQALALKPDLAGAHNNIGNILRLRGQLDDALRRYQRAIALQPDFAEALNNVANIHADKGHVEEALAYCRKALSIKPEMAEAHDVLGRSLQQQGAVDQAIASYQLALQLKADCPDARNHLGHALRELGRIDEAVACFRQAIDEDPDDLLPHDNLLLTLHLHPATDARTLQAEGRRWNLRHAAPLKQHIRPHTNNRDPDRPLRIGYVSPDLRGHPAGRFTLPLLNNHDRALFEVYAYAQVRVPDGLTEKLKSHTRGWRSIVGVPDQDAAELIRNDRIDILVDLAMHSSDNRLLVFARKPAPVQVTYLAYAGGTALDTIDYRLTDRYLDPDPANDCHYMEKSFHLAGTYWCYLSTTSAPPVNPLPALTTQSVTFGCLNDFSKVSPPALETWATLLLTVPHSRLLLHSPIGGHRDGLLAFLRDRGIAPGRIEFLERVSPSQYFAAHHRIDIALDPFPYAGGTTTCDALWMGVPVVTLAGQTAVGRAGVSILSNVGLPELIAQSTQEYIQIAAALAGDLPRLSNLRATLRQRMESSPLMDAPAFARAIEDAYRTMWQTWCAKQNP